MRLHLHECSWLESFLPLIDLVGVNVEFFPLAVRLLFVGGTNTIPPDVVMVSIIINHDSC